MRGLAADEIDLGEAAEEQPPDLRHENRHLSIFSKHVEMRFVAAFAKQGVDTATGFLTTRSKGNC